MTDRPDGLGDRGSRPAEPAAQPLVADERAERSPEEQLRELEREARQAFEVLQAALPPLGVAGAQRRGDDRLEQRGLPVDARANRPQVARLDPVLRQP